MAKTKLVSVLLLCLLSAAAYANEEDYRSDQDQEHIRIMRERQNQNQDSDRGGASQDTYQSPPPKDPVACRLFGAFNSALCDTEDETE
jgi:hypothetical protein